MKPTTHRHSLGALGTAAIGLSCRFLASLVLLLGLAGAAADSLERGFVSPPPETRPWVYWFWLNGNISSTGITADLEAMQRVGVGGVLIMEVDQGIPAGPVDFMGPSWRGMFQHVVSEARRLGLEVNMNDDAGWNGSGGPWVQPAQAMQKVVFTETNLEGPRRFEGPLPQPETVAGYYQDIAVVAFPATGSYRIPSIRGKAMYETGYSGGIPGDTVPQDSVMQRPTVLTLTARMDSSGRLSWDVPAGRWTVLRLGHTCTGVENAPAPKTGRGLECDKLSKEGIEANLAGMIERLADDNHLKPGNMGPGLVATHIDSWENGSQNWTPRMREEFQNRRGYDLFPFLPVFTGRVVDSLEVTERFLRDLRQTVSDLVVENYAGRMRELAHAHGLRFTVEAYGSPCDFVPYGGQADEPMGEFWSPSGAIETCKGMAGCGHVYGKRIIGAESFTAGDQERWREHPGALKALGDRAFCEGINRFVFHRFALQPWAEPRRPGMTMGPWGQHYERTETWWEETPAWHRYLARCQFLLRQGLYSADICYLQAESPLQGFNGHPRHGYDWDECGADVVLNLMSVKDGRLALPGGMRYRVLVLPATDAMTPALLRKVKDLAEAGATIIGSPPRRSPGLTDYPECDAKVKALAGEIWAGCDGARVTEHPLGKGRVVWQTEAEKVLRQSGIAPDFTSHEPLGHIHRIVGDADLYFVANSAPRRVETTATFRVAGRVPELWWPESGRLERAPVYGEHDGLTTVALTLEPSGSVFVVFRARSANDKPVIAVARDGKALFSGVPEPPTPVVVRSAVYGLPGDPAHTRDVAGKVRGYLERGEYNFPVVAMAAGDDPAPGAVKTLTVDYSIGGKQYVVKGTDHGNIFITPDAVKITVQKAHYWVLGDPTRSRDVRDRVQRLADAGETSFVVARMAEGDDPALMVVKTLELEYTINGRQVSVTGIDPDLIELRPPILESAERVAEVHGAAAGRVRVLAFKPGLYESRTAAGKSRERKVADLPAPVEVGGPWEVRLDPNLGAPEVAAFDRLISWTARPEPGIKYFSGPATYRKTLEVPRAMRSGHRRVFLDLGRVEVMARVKLNGKDLGVLWKPPFRLDITEAAKSGENRLEVRVINLWPNRLIGDEQLPQDSDRNADGSLKSWPPWLQAGQPSPAGRIAFTTWRLWKKTDAPLESGLLGPVSLTAAEQLEL